MSERRNMIGDGANGRPDWATWIATGRALATSPTGP